MNKIEATFRIVTPMFIGGANQEPGDGIRPPSVKGALRFWWRALNWGSFYERGQQNENEALNKLHEEEARLFGVATDGKSRGQGCFLLEVTNQPPLNHFVDDWPQSHTARGANSKSGYLGLGLFEMNEHSQRKAIFEDKLFSIRLLFKANKNEEASRDDIEQIRTALVAFGLFGGLGGRSRRGFGSVALINMDGEKVTQTQSLNEYKKAIGEIRKQITTQPNMPPYTAFSEHVKVGIGLPSSDARQTHSDAGELYLNHRGQSSDLRGRAKRCFGLPLEGVSTPEERRASPLFFHIHPVGQQFICLNLFLPAKFQPGENTEVEDFSNVASFFDGLEVLP